MIGEKCESCRDEVLIIKNLQGKKLCLDCYCKYKDKPSDLFKKPANESNKIQIEQIKPTRDRRCPNCGRIIPFDSVVCPYCGKRFETFL